MMKTTMALGLEGRCRWPGDIFRRQGPRHAATCRCDSTTGTRTWHRPQYAFPRCVRGSPERTQGGDHGRHAPTQLPDEPMATTRRTRRTRTPEPTRTKTRTKTKTRTRTTTTTNSLNWPWPGPSGPCSRVESDKQATKAAHESSLHKVTDGNIARVLPSCRSCRSSCCCWSFLRAVRLCAGASAVANYAAADQHVASMARYGSLKGSERSTAEAEPPHSLRCRSAAAAAAAAAGIGASIAVAFAFDTVAADVALGASPESRARQSSRRWRRHRLLRLPPRSRTPRKSQQAAGLLAVGRSTSGRCCCYSFETASLKVPRHRPTLPGGTQAQCARIRSVRSSWSCSSPPSSPPPPSVISARAYSAAAASVRRPDSRKNAVSPQCCSRCR